MRGFLKSREGVFQLAAGITSVGTEGCDLVLKDSSSGCARAVIEYVYEDSSFVLKDLDSVHGVYVNDCRIQNASVKLEPNDILRFAYNGIAYEFLVECDPSKTSTASTRQPSSIKLASPSNMYYDSLVEMSSSLKSTGRKSQESGIKVNGKISAHSTSNGLGDAAGWISGPRMWEQQNKSSDTQLLPGNSDYSQKDISQRLDCLTSEVQRLLVFENECALKDDLIEQLQEEITNLQNFIRQAEVGCCSECQKFIVGGAAKSLNLKRGRSFDQTLNNDSNLDERLSFIQKMNADLDRARSDCRFYIGAMTQMHRDMSNKDTTISTMAREMQQLRKKLEEKDDEIFVLEASLNRLNENSKLSGVVESVSEGEGEGEGGGEGEGEGEGEDEASESAERRISTTLQNMELSLRSKDREIALLRRKQEIADNRKLELASEIRTLKEDMTKKTALCEAAQLAEKKLKAEIESLKFKCQDLERAEKLVRVDLEQMSKRFEKLRSRVVQAVFAGSSVKSPDKPLGDEELATLLRKVADDRAENARKPQTSDTPVSDKKSTESVKRSKP